MAEVRPVFYVSDGTGITAETIGHSLLTQFTETRFITDRIPFVDSVERARTGTRPVCFDPAEGYVETGVYWRPDLRAGDEVSGPVIVEEFGSTVPVHPGFTVRVDAYGNLVITKESAK